MPFSRILALSASVLCLSLQSAQAVDSSRNDGFLSVTEQRDALVDCKHDLGRGGWPKLQATYVERPWGGETVVRIQSNQFLSPQDAAWVNSCADQKLGRSTETVAKPADQPSGICPKHAPVMYGGTRYCIGRR